MQTTDNIAILGYGVEGRAMALYLLDHGFSRITVCDQKLDVDLMDEFSARLGEDYLQGLEDFDVVFRSPGISVNVPELAGVRAMGKLTSVTQFFLEKCPCPVIGVTGTKGKGTTSTLIFEMLRGAGRDVHLGGNIGEPPVNFLDELRSKSLVILEMSSFQLMDSSISPHVAVVLNVTSEHMDYHASVEEYRVAKMNIARFQKAENFLILNADYPYVQQYSGSEFLAKKIFVSRGSELPCGRDEVGLLGEHHLENIAAAIAVAKIFDVPRDVIARVVREFTGLPHRLEFVDERAGVRFYNDSFSTIPETSIAGFTAFAHGKSAGPVFLLAGGSEKNSDYSEWGKAVNADANLKKVFLVGPSGERMAREISPGPDDTARFEMVKNLKEGFEKAFREADIMAHAGERPVVLLSPGAASFNEFKNYKERGEAFRALLEFIR